MKQMNIRKILSILLTLAVIYTMMPMQSMAATPNDITSAVVGEAASLVFTTESETLWAIDTDEGKTCVKGSPTAAISTTVTGAGWLIFDWKFNNGSWQDSFTLAGNGITQEQIKANSSSNKSWATKVVAVTGEGEHLLTWTYDAATTGNFAYLRQVRFVSSKTSVSLNCDSQKGTVTVTGTGITEIAAQAEVAPGTAITCSAEAKEGYIFAGWKVNETDTDYIATSAQYTTTVYDTAINLATIYVQPFIGKGTQTEPYQLNTYANLQEFKQLVDNGNDFKNIYFVINENIVCEDTFTTIGEDSQVFSGIIDGTNHSITGLKNQLFYKLDNAQIKNIIVEAQISSTKDNTGILAGYASQSKIVNCKTRGSITSSGAKTGGVIGYASGSNLDECSSSVSVVSTKSSYISAYVGGITGSLSSGSIKNTYFIGTVQADGGAVAGITGDTTGTASISGCYVDSVSIIGYRYVGGIAGQFTSTQSISDCAVKGLVKATQDSASAAEAGGIIGYNEKNTDIIILQNCYSLAIIETKGYGGGIVGYTTKKGTIQNCTALNEKITGAMTGRIVGVNIEASWGGATTLTNNYAYADMHLYNSSNEEVTVDLVGKDTKNGESITADTLKSTQTVAEVFTNYDSQIWTVAAGKLPVLTKIQMMDKTLQSSILPTYITGNNPGIPSDPSLAVDDALKASLLKGTQENIYLSEASNLKSADGNKIILVDLWGDVAGNNAGDRDVVQTCNIEGASTAYLTFTVNGKGYLFFDWLVKTSGATDKFEICINNAEPLVINDKTFSLDTTWKTAFYYLTEDINTVTITYTRGKSNADTGYFYLLDELRFVSDEDAGINIQAEVSDESGGTAAINKDASKILPGKSVEVTAQEQTGYQFMGWKYSLSDKACFSTEKTISVTAYDKDIKVYAVFIKPFGEDGTKFDPYSIDSKEDLIVLSELVNAQINFKGNYFVLNKDIDLSSVDFIPIGNLNSSFSGNFDGANHTISNLSITGIRNLGLFGNIDENAVVSNLIMTNCNIEGTTDGSNLAVQIGMLAGVSEGTISNCQVQGKVHGVKNIGGLVGNTLGGNIDKCSANGIVLADGNYDDATVGGIVGSNGADITNCYFKGTITGIGRYVGGICGSSYMTINACFTDAVVKSQKCGTSNIDASAVGGILGSGSGDVLNSYSTGTVYGDRDNTGGIVGKSTSGAAIKYCYTTAKITGAGNNVGGIAGYTTSVSSSKAIIKGNVCLSERLQCLYTNEQTRQFSTIVGKNDGGWKDANLADVIKNYTYADITLTDVQNQKVAAEIDADNMAIGRTDLDSNRIAAAFSSWNATFWEVQAGKFPILKKITANLQNTQLNEYLKVPPVITSIKKYANAVKLSAESYVYDGKAKKPEVSIKSLVKNTDYKIAYSSNNINVGTATVTITGIGNYKDSITKTYNITNATPNLTFKASTVNKKYKDAAFTNILTKKTDGTITYSSSNNNIATVTSAGKVTIKSAGKVTITAKAAAGKNYKSGSKSYTLYIARINNTITASNYKKVAKTKEQSFTIAVKRNGNAKLSYSSNKKSVKVYSSGKVKIAKNFVGTTTITIKANATTNYNTVVKKITITVNPMAVSISKLTNIKTKKLTVQWKKVSMASGYQIQYSTDKKFEKAVKTTKITKSATLTKTISSLTKNKTYYVKIRTYKTVSDKNYYSAWSDRKSKKITK